MRILAYKASVTGGKILIEENGGETVHTTELNKLFEFLMNDTPDAIRICWNLDSFAAVLFRIITKDKLQKLAKTHKTYLPPFNMFYISGKVLSISHIPSGERVNFYHLEQYFPELEEPQDIEELKMLGDKLLYELDKMKLHPTKLTSPVAVYDECVMGKLDLPTAQHMPPQAAEYAYRCSGRLWIESFQLGYWENIYDYDLSSAFPNIAKDLYDIRQMKWIQSKEHQPGAVYGYAKVRVTIYPTTTVSPIMTQIDENLVCPVGTWEDWYTIGELAFIKNWNIGEYQIIDAWWAIPIFALNRMRKPLQEPLDALLEYRKHTGLQSALAKRMAAGVYGKFGEERLEEFGQHFNPCYFAEISTECRLKVAAFIYLNQQTPLHIGVDGVIFEQPAIPETLGSEWRLSHTGEVLIISSGLVYTKTTRPKGLTLPIIKSMIAEHPDKSYYSTKLRRRLTLGDALAQNKLEEVGTIVELNSNIHLVNMARGRTFKKFPKTGKQLLSNKYKSVPKEM